MMLAKCCGGKLLLLLLLGNSKLDPDDDRAVSYADGDVPLEADDSAEGLGSTRLLECPDEEEFCCLREALATLLALLGLLRPAAAGGWMTGGCWISRAQFSLWFNGLVGLNSGPSSS